MHISTSSMHISTPTEQGAKFGVCDTPVMASVESSLLMADTTPCDSANENSAIHWGECMICQKVTREELKCPSNGSRFDAGAVYEAFAGRFEELRQVSEPSKQHFKLHYLFDQDTLPNITDKMLSNNGKWHKNCFVQFNDQHINRLHRRQLRKRQLPGTLNSAELTDPDPTEPVGAPEPTEPVGATTTPFMSAMAIDQQGEQMVQVWKSQGGPSNVTQKPAAMLEEI